MALSIWGKRPTVDELKGWSANFPRFVNIVVTRYPSLGESRNINILLHSTIAVLSLYLRRRRPTRSGLGIEIILSLPLTTSVNSGSRNMYGWDIDWSEQFSFWGILGKGPQVEPKRIFTRSGGLLKFLWSVGPPEASSNIHDVHRGTALQDLEKCKLGSKY